MRSNSSPRCRRPGHAQAAHTEGATLVEFAIALPLLVLLIFGAIDFGWAFSQNLDVKHGAREGARLAIVNAGRDPGPPQTDANRDSLISAIKSRTADLTDSREIVWIGRENVAGSSAPDDIGDLAVVCLTYPLESLSGVSKVFLSGRLKAQVTMRLEKAPDWTISSGANPCL